MSWFSGYKQSSRKGVSNEENRRLTVKNTTEVTKNNQKKYKKNNGVIKKNMFILKKVKISRLKSKYYFENKVEMCRLQLFFRIQQLLQLLYPLQKPCVDELVKQPDQLSYDARGCYHQNPCIGVLILANSFNFVFFPSDQIHLSAPSLQHPYTNHLTVFIC